MSLRDLVAVGLLLAGLTACSTRVRPEVLQAWVGKPATALVQEWGPATREVQDGETRVYIYEQIERAAGDDFQSRLPTQRNTYGRAEEADQLLRAPSVHVRSYLFWVSREGVIVQSGVREP